MMNAVICIYIASFIHSTLGATFEIIQDQPGEVLICNYTATVICNFAVNKSSINWKIAPDVDLSSTVAAQCFSSSCSVNPAFAANYDFTFNKIVGVSNVTIKKVTVEQENLEFKCDDGNPPNKVKLNVRVPPNEKTTVKRNITVGNDTILSIETACIYPVQDIVIQWYSVGVDTVIHNESVTTYALCHTGSDCILANKSAQYTSVLNISKISLSNGKRSIQRSTSSSSIRLFEVVIKYDSNNSRSIRITIGNFSVQDTPIDDNETTNSALSTAEIVGISCSVVGVVVLVVVIVVVVIVRKKKKKEERKKEEKKKEDEKKKEEEKKEEEKKKEEKKKEEEKKKKKEHSDTNNGSRRSGLNTEDNQND